MKMKINNSVNNFYEIKFVNIKLKKRKKFKMSDLDYQQNDVELSQAQRIASQTTAKAYFLNQEQHLLDEWGNKSLDLFKFTTQVFMKEYQIKSSNLTEKYGHNYEDLYSKCRKQFEAYCILNRKVQKKNDQIDNFATFFNTKIQKKVFFNEWKKTVTRQKQLRLMEDRAEKQRQTKTLKNCLKAWLNQTMKSNKLKIKNDVLRRTQIQISKVQQEYEKIIKTLEQTLEKKLTDLKKQQEQHKLLHDKYQSMYTRSKV